MPIQSIVWLVVVVLLFAAEAATVGLVSIWFGVGALTGLVISFFCRNVWIQLGVFLAVSFVCLLAVRPLVRKYIAPRKVATNADRTVGAEGVVTQAVDNLAATGQITVGGTVWTARTEEGAAPIAQGAQVRVLRIEGVKVIVTPIQTPVPGAGAGSSSL